MGNKKVLVFNLNKYAWASVIGFIIGILPLFTFFTNKFDKVVDNFILFIPRTLVDRIYGCALCGNIVNQFILMIITNILLYISLSLFLVFLFNGFVILLKKRK